jgi:ankyrin repeat protein
MSKGNTEIITVLLDNGANKEQALTIAIASKRNNLIDLVIGMEPSITSTHVTSVAKTGNATLIESILTAGGDADLALKTGLEAGHTSSKYISACVNAGAQPDSAMPAAIKKNDQALVKLLIENGANGSDDTYLKTATKNKNTAMVTTLLEAGGDPNSAIKEAININNTEITALLLKNGADASSPSFLTTAIKNKNTAIVTKLLEAGASPDEGIQEAVTLNNPEILMLLLKNGADGSSDELLKASVKHNNTALSSPLIKANSNPSVALQATLDAKAHLVLQLLADHKVDLTAPKLLSQVIVKRQMEMAKVLVANGNDVQYIDEVSGNTYLHIAAKNNFTDIISYLTNQGLDINVENNQGDLPIHVALNIGKKGKNLIKKMISLGADVTKSNGAGKTCNELGQSRRIRKILKKAGAPQS